MNRQSALGRQIIVEPDSEASDSSDGNAIGVVAGFSRRSSNLRQFRHSHYISQRASQAVADAQPLIQRPEPAIARGPTPSQTFQTHHVVAICFNRMAGRYCEHCEQLNRNLPLHERASDGSPHSSRTLEQHSSPFVVNGGNEKEQNMALYMTGQEEKKQDEEKPDGGEKGGQKGPSQPVGLWHSDLAKLRLQSLGLWARIVLILCVFILAVLSMYWAVLYHVIQNISSLDVFVVDFDGTQSPYLGVTPLIGPMITQTTEQILRAPDPHLGYITMDPAAFNHDPIQVRQAVYDFKAWAAIIINANATGLIQQAVDTGNASYDPLGACQIVTVEARDQETYAAYILPQMSALKAEITSKFGQMWTKKVLSNTSIPITNLQAAPQALSPAIGFSTFSLRPFTPPVTTPAVTIGLIYLIILAFFSFSFFLPIYMKFIASDGHPPIKFYKLIIIRWCGTNMAYFFMSLAYSLISLAFQIPFSSPPAPDTIVSDNPDAYGKGTFMVYWMINFVGMSALGLACENVAMVIGQPWTAMWLIFWVITNVATAFYSLELAPKWYYWGYAWPLHNIVEASRSTLFDLHSRIGLNFGVLFAWVVINTALFPLCCYFMRLKTIKAKKREMEAKQRVGK